MSDLVFRSAGELARDLRRGERSAREVMEAHLERIAEVNPRVNAIVSLDADRAMARAALADEQQAAGEPLGLLHGLPIAHKDLVETAGMRTTFGSPVFAEWVPEVDALLVERYRSEGAILIGKTNTPELGAGSQTFNPVFGPTRNPYDLDLTCGGSSGGAAVALATGMLPIADGSDLGGSLRNPAAFCNVVGFRPSPGRVPSWPTTAAWNHLSTDGPMGRSVADVALQMRALVGYDPRSPIALETDPDVFDLDFERAPERVRVAWSADLGGLPVDPAITEALEGARLAMESMGWEIAEDEPDLSDAREIFQVERTWLYEVGLGPLLDEHGEQLKNTVRWNIERARSLHLTDHTRVARLRDALFERVRRFFEGYDVLACPVTQVVPFPIEVEYPTEVAGVPMETYIDWMRACSDVTVTECPAISVPGGFTAGGLPVGLQLVGRRRDDVGLLKIAAAFEQATGFGARRPEPIESSR